MIWPFKNNSKPSDAVYGVYNAIVAQSRHPIFYADWSVPDTVTGRFDMICLHMSLVFIRLRSRDAKDRLFSQELFDLFFKDMDRSLREMGVGDVSVPKRIEKMGAIFYGLLEKLTEALDLESDDMLEGVIARNFFDADHSDAAKPLVSYVRQCADVLAKQEVAAIMAGELNLGEVV